MSALPPAPIGNALLHSAFYRFTELPAPAQAAARLRALGAALGDTFGGSILVAPEGINGAVAGSPADVAAFEAALAHDPAFAGRFAGMAFKRSACATPPFARLKVHVRPEAVAVGIPGASGLRAGGTALAPQDWRTLLARSDVVLLDNRNSFEHRLGHFRGALDPGAAHFRDFPAYVQAHAPQWRAEGRPVAMYCTGGIRCEKTAAWMQDQELDVYQLAGGILHYFAALPDAERDWVGECFVFDNRIALDTRLRETATTAEQVYDSPADAWRLARARRLMAAA
ncbi:hypothetical protein PY257_10710 [Ramlibacter sp. H39-3-26]|uniref:oxygen-dependent tRNA uridine(34) hydroxylase TrhO n=1 Tax=Curvibacter soli TaxID=3031331 RepID=UPI0023DC1EF0|nr:rhodanese-like domain-containing protein [Ramlibacter sp. H39-3-26]MDF1485645.1 hypothetical protein [Ramlibacter sp. H39-3-26]